jgi:carbon-monoxide dehydrogenase small subunit
MTRQILRITVNGTDREVLIEQSQVLLEVLRENLRLTGTKFGCELGECGVCTVLIDGEPALSCLTLAALCEGRSVTTVEGLQGREADIVRRSFAEAGASQCGYCTPSMAVMLTYLLSKGEDVDIRAELSGNLCRCTGYTKIIEAYRRCVELTHE